MAGIGGFLRHTKENSFGGGGQWLNWKDEKQVTVWLHTRVVPLVVWNHSFSMVDVVEDRDTGRPKPVMRFNRFVSPDPEPVHRQQHWRKEDGSLKMPPDRDPFLLLREWLRTADHIGLEDTVFAWRDPKDNKVTVWNRGEISGLVKRARANFNHSLDTRMEYLFVVVRNDDIAKGAYLSRESAALGRRLGEVIEQQQAGLGDQGGDPLLNPYAFVWAFDPKKSPNEMYKVWKAEGVKYTEEVFDAITGTDYPDPSEFAVVRDGDMEKIRAAFQSAAKVELPLDQIFSEDPAVRQALCGGQKKRPAMSTPGNAAKPTGARSEAATPVTGPQRPGAAAATVPQNGVSRPVAAAPMNGTATAKVPAAMGGRRRRKAEEPPPPPPEPEIERVPCDCGFMMPATATTCEQCGAVWEIEDDELVDSNPVSASTQCFACKGPLDAKGYCTVCKLDSGDEIPF
jgi:hypothetical protein